MKKSAVGVVFVFLWLVSFPAFAAGPLLFNVGNCLTTTPVSPSTSSALTIPPNPQNLLGSYPVNLQTGTSYAIVASDRCKFVKFSNSGAISASLPATVLPSGWMTFVKDTGAGGLTITPATGQIESASSLTLPQGTPGIIFSDGSNYHVFYYNAAAGTITINSVSCAVGGSCTVPASPNTLTLGSTTLTLGGTTTTVNALTVGTTWLVTVTSTSSTSYTFASTDCGTTVSFTSSSAITATMPNSLPIGCVIIVAQDGTGQVTFAAGSGATINNAHGYTKTFGHYAMVGLYVNANSGGSSAVADMTGDGA